MNIIIFAGGAGTRLWPLSRRNSPKQFEILKDDKSTLQMAVERVSAFGMDNIYISTNDSYIPLVKTQIPDLPADHILGEPARRDVAAAVGLSLMRLKKLGVKGTIAVLWADHFMDRPEQFVGALKKAESLIKRNPNRFVFLGEKPRFANHNLGWIKVDGKIDFEFEFLGWKYRPELADCVKMFESGEWLWNPGYFVFDIDFVLGLYKKFVPEMHIALEEMAGDDDKVKKMYSNLQKISFDNAILESISPEQAVVLKVDLGWSDPGTLYALKEALVSNKKDNYTKGNVITHESSDSFVYNEEAGKIVAGVGLGGMIVVNTRDAILVCQKDKVPEIKSLLKKMENESLEKYL